MGMLTLDEVTEKMIKLESELDSLKKGSFSKFFIFNIRKKEMELSELSKIRGNLLSPDNFLNKFAQDKIVVYIPTKYVGLSKLLGLTCSRMRVSMAENWGYIVPIVRLLDKDDLKEDEFEIVLRGGAESSIFKFEPNLPKEELCNSIIARLQSYLFDRAEVLLSFFDMFLYVRAAKLNETDLVQELGFWHDYSQWFAYNLGYILSPLLSERYCIKNINYILDFVYTQILYENRSKDYVLRELRKTLKKYPESLFVSSWTLKANQ